MPGSVDPAQEPPSKKWTPTLSSEASAALNSPWRRGSASSSTDNVSRLTPSQCYQKQQQQQQHQSTSQSVHHHHHHHQSSNQHHSAQHHQQYVSRSSNTTSSNSQYVNSHHGYQNNDSTTVNRTQQPSQSQRNKHQNLQQRTPLKTGAKTQVTKHFGNQTQLWSNEPFGCPHPRCSAGRHVAEKVVATPADMTSAPTSPSADDSSPQRTDPSKVINWRRSLSDKADESAPESPSTPTTPIEFDQPQKSTRRPVQEQMQQQMQQQSHGWYTFTTLEPFLKHLLLRHRIAIRKPRVVLPYLEEYVKYHLKGVNSKQMEVVQSRYSTPPNLISKPTTMFCVNCVGFPDPSMAECTGTRVCKCEAHGKQCEMATCVVVGSNIVPRNGLNVTEQQSQDTSDTSSEDEETTKFEEAANDMQLRESLRLKKLREIVKIQHEERTRLDNDDGPGMTCVFNNCETEEKYHSRLELTRHMLDEHGINIGLADNIVYIEDLLKYVGDCVNGTQNRFKCITCHEEFSAQSALLTHMEQREHFHLGGDTTIHDRHYINNYLLPGLDWQQIRAQMAMEVYDVYVDESGKVLTKNAIDNDTWDEWQDDDGVSECADECAEDCVGKQRQQQRQFARRNKDQQLIGAECLVCDTVIYCGRHACLRHMREEHKFDFLQLLGRNSEDARRDANDSNDTTQDEVLALEDIEEGGDFGDRLQMSFYDAVRFVNWMRLLKHGNVCFRCGIQMSNGTELANHHKETRHCETMDISFTDTQTGKVRFTAVDRVVLRHDTSVSSGSLLRLERVEVASGSSLECRNEAEVTTSTVCRRRVLRVPKVLSNVLESTGPDSAVEGGDEPLLVPVIGGDALLTLEELMDREEAAAAERARARDADLVARHVAHAQRLASRALLGKDSGEHADDDSDNEDGHKNEDGSIAIDCGDEIDSDVVAMLREEVLSAYNNNDIGDDEETETHKTGPSWAAAYAGATAAAAPVAAERAVALDDDAIARLLAPVAE